ncbi:MAG TPA: endonuclease/exonuclease/phosphatase family protein [Stellaceae bacterium]|nr:endonuclease/exonuclease/phosphatase family protein [Stellaceae bacterium]
MFGGSFKHVGARARVTAGRQARPEAAPEERLFSLYLPAPPPGALRLVTYNIHSCVGVDRRYDPARVAAVLQAIDADIACLQEVYCRRVGERQLDQAAYLGRMTGCRVITGTGVRDHRRRFRNAILTRLPVLAARSIDLTITGHEPRGAIDLDLLFGERMLRVIATHFGLSAAERRLQTNCLIAALGQPTADRRPPDAVLLMGDLNEWRGRSGGIGALDRRLGPAVAPRTFPSWMPVLPLDRIYADGPAVLRGVQAYRSPVARLASDHLPLVGELSLGVAVEPRREPPQPPRRHILKTVASAARHG